MYVCFKGVSVVWLHVSQDGDQFFGGGQLALERHLEEYICARLYQIVPQTDSGR